MIDRMKLEIKREPFPSPLDLSLRMRLGGFIAPIERSYPLHNYRTGKTVYLCKSEMEDRDTVADFLPQDAALLGYYNALVDEGHTPLRAMATALGSLVNGPLGGEE